VELSQVVQLALHDGLRCKNRHILHEANMYKCISNGMHGKEDICAWTDLESNAAEGKGGEA
jgi:hypothetical protein